MEIRFTLVSVLRAISLHNIIGSHITTVHLQAWNECVVGMRTGMSGRLCYDAEQRVLLQYPSNIVQISVIMRGPAHIIHHQGECTHQNILQRDPPADVL